MTGSWKPGSLWRYALFAAVLAALLPAGQTARAQVAGEQEVCGLMKTYCAKVNGAEVNAAICKSARKIKRTYKYACGRERRKRSAGPQACRGHVERGRVNTVVSLSVDTRNRSIFGYCVKGSGPAARQCAYEACLQKGGRYCSLPCDTRTGKEIRACRTDTVTLVTSGDYARLGCGERHVRSGDHDFNSYIKRELERCLKNSKKPGSCRLEAAWQ